MWEQQRFADGKRVKPTKEPKEPEKETKKRLPPPGSQAWNKMHRESQKLGTLTETPSPVLTQAKVVKQTAGFPKARSMSNSSVSIPNSPITTYQRPSSTMSNISTETTVEEPLQKFYYDSVQDDDIDILSLITGVTL